MWENEMMSGAYVMAATLHTFGGKSKGEDAGEGAGRLNRLKGGERGKRGTPKRNPSCGLQIY